MAQDPYVHGMLGARLLLDELRGRSADPAHLDPKPTRSCWLRSSNRASAPLKAEFE